MNDENQINSPDQQSEIVNSKKQLILKVDQTSDFVYPNELFKYQIYCKNVSGDIIENVHIQVINPSEIAIDEDNEIPPEGIEIGDLNNGQSHLLYLKARCSMTGEFTVHFLCFGDESELHIESVTINCNYDSYSNKTIHKIHIYNFTPYEDTYELLSQDFNEDVTQLVKRQKLPYKAKENPFKMIKGDLSLGTLVDESQNYIDQKNELYNDQYKADEHTYQYLERENFNRESFETFEGENLSKILDDINKYSKFFKVTKIRTGTNKLFNDFKQYNPDGFIYRFGLMSSEIYHHLGVLPEYSYMNDYLFRWAAEGQLPSVMYPKHVDMQWDQNKWAGHGWNVWKIYTDEYKEQIINNEDYRPLFEFIHTFELLETAEEYIQNEYNFDSSNEFYINTEDGIEKIRKYKYIIKESYFDNGVFFVHIPLGKIPSNFILLNTEDIEAIIEKTKPYGMKALIKYVIDTKFNIHLGFNSYTKLQPNTKLDFGKLDKIRYSLIPYEYENVIETVCSMENNEKVFKDRETTKLIPKGVGYYDSVDFNIKPYLTCGTPEPTNRANMQIEPIVENKMVGCELDNDLTFFSQIRELLYQGNFESISFKIKEIPTTQINNLIVSTEPDISFDKISAVDYKLWIESLSINNKNQDPHSHWWTKEECKEVNFFELPLENPQMTQEGIEVGIGFEDLRGKLYGLSSEFIRSTNNIKIKYATSMNNNFKIEKQGFGKVTGLSFKFVESSSNVLVVFFIKMEEDNEISYHYFNHVVVDDIKNLFCFTRNNKDITTIRSWSNIIKVGKNIDSEVIFNTPKYLELKSYNPLFILDKENSNWANVDRIDKNEHSYASITNIQDEDITPKPIEIHFDQIDIPNDSIVTNIKLNAILESNSYKNIYPSIRLQDGFIIEDSYDNTISISPNEIECYPLYNNNTKHYEKQYELAKINNISDSIKSYESKISENRMFNESLEFSVDYTDLDESITIQKPYWIEISDFTSYNISFNNVEEAKLCIEGYNSGKEVYLLTQLREDDVFADKKETLIPSGYFKKYITLDYLNSFFTDSIQLRFRFKNLNAELELFDTYLKVSFKEKQNESIEFMYSDPIDIEKKKSVEINLIDYPIPAYHLLNGITTKLEFDDLVSGEYYRIYSIELDVTYQRENIDFLVNRQSYEIDNTGHFNIVSGQTKNDYMSGMFFNEIVMPGTYQELSTLNSENQGIELKDTLYQSFIASRDNMTSITLFPNGFVGNPDVNLKIGLYENKANTPNKLIKEIRVSGWSKANANLKNKSIINYDFNVNNLTIGNKYWIKIQVENPSESNYYLLKYIDSSQYGFKLLTKIDNNLINVFGSLKFYVNTLNSFKSFNSLPASEDNEEFSDPKIFISLNKQIGEIKGIKVKKDSG